MRTVLFALLASVAPGAACQQQPESRPSTLPTNAEELLALLAQNRVRVDMKAHTLTVDTTVGEPADPIEYLLIHPRGKAHEAVLICDVLPSILNAGLLAIGFEAGANARAEEIKPAPTLEQVQAGAPWIRVFPPEGKSVWLTVAWEHDGHKHDVPVEELLLDRTTGEAVRDSRWVYLGGNWAPLLRGEEPVFVGDYAGNVVSSCYMHPPNHLVTISHERGPDEQNWWMTPLCPPPGTKVALTFHRDKPASVAEREKRLAAQPKTEPPSGEAPKPEPPVKAPDETPPPRR